MSCWVRRSCQILPPLLALSHPSALPLSPPSLLSPPCPPLPSSTSPLVHCLLHDHSYHPLHYYHCSRPLHVHHPPSSTSRAPPLSWASWSFCVNLSWYQQQRRLTTRVISKKPGTIAAKATIIRILFILKRQKYQRYWMKESWKPRL